MTPEAVRDLKEQCLGFHTITDLQRARPALYQRVRKAGLQSICFAHMHPPRRVPWTVERMRAEIQKLNPTTRDEIWQARPDLAAAIWRAGLSDQLMPPSRRGKK